MKKIIVLLIMLAIGLQVASYGMKAKRAFDVVKKQMDAEQAIVMDLQTQMQQKQDEIKALEEPINAARVANDTETYNARVKKYNKLAAAYQVLGSTYQYHADLYQKRATELTGVIKKFSFGLINLPTQQKQENS
jgi:uncharacterized protein YlxW (UPF0749 family)